MKLFKSINMGQDVCIDLGTDYICIYITGEGIVLREPSSIAINRDTGEIVAVGQDAALMEEKSPKKIITKRPVRNGVVTDTSLAGELIGRLLSKVIKNKFIKPKVMLTIPSEISDIEGRAAIEAAMNGNARQVMLVEAPVAAAVGAGCDVTIARGLMVLDIGDGKTDIGAISVCNIVAGKTINVGADAFTFDIKEYVKRKHSIEIGTKTAKMVKEKLCSEYGEDENSMEIYGSDIITKMPRKTTVFASEFDNIFDRNIEMIARSVKEMLDVVPPELLGDIMEDGILMVGGGAKLKKMAEKLTLKSGIRIFPANEMELCTIKGAGLLMENIDALPNIAQSYHNL